MVIPVAKGCECLWPDRITSGKLWESKLNACIRRHALAAGAGKETRTLIVSPPPDFESGFPNTWQYMTTNYSNLGQIFSYCDVLPRVVDFCRQVDQEWTIYFGSPGKGKVTC